MFLLHVEFEPFLGPVAIDFHNVNNHGRGVEKKAGGGWVGDGHRELRGGRSEALLSGVGLSAFLWALATLSGPCCDASHEHGFSTLLGVSAALSSEHRLRCVGVQVFCGVSGVQEFILRFKVNDIWVGSKSDPGRGPEMIKIHCGVNLTSFGRRPKNGQNFLWVKPDILNITRKSERQVVADFYRSGESNSTRLCQCVGL